MIGRTRWERGVTILQKVVSMIRRHVHERLRLLLKGEVYVVVYGMYADLPVNATTN